MGHPPRWRDSVSRMDHLDPHFTFLFQLLKDNYDSYSSYILSTTGVILTIIGWLLTSKDARAYIAERAGIKLPMYLVIAFFFLAEIYFSIGAWRTSCHVASLLQALPDKTIAADYYRSKEVPLRGVVLFDTAHGVLYAMLIAIIYSISGRANSK
jgi:hypothetical protein